MALAKRHAVLTFDRLRTGETPPAPEPYTTRSFARDALGLEAAHVLGHSMGGRVAR